MEVTWTARNNETADIVQDCADGKITFVQAQKAFSDQGWSTQYLYEAVMNARRAGVDDASSAMARISDALACSAADIADAMRAAVAAEREVCAMRTREIAALYEAGSDARNTFVLLAEWIEARSET